MDDIVSSQSKDLIHRFHPRNEAGREGGWLGELLFLQEEDIVRYNMRMTVYIAGK